MVGEALACQEGDEGCLIYFDTLPDQPTITLYAATTMNKHVH